MDDELIAHIRSRVAQCRRLASMINDPPTIAVLLQMAEEAEADLRKLLPEDG